MSTDTSASWRSRSGKKLRRSLQHACLRESRGTGQYNAEENAIDFHDRRLFSTWKG